MKRNLLLLILLSFNMMVFGQDITVDNGSHVQNFTSSEDVPFDIEAHTMITNNTSSDIEITWERTVNDITDTWSTNICVDQGCYGPGTGDHVEIIPANTSVNFYFHARPNDVCGMVNADITIKRTSNGELFGTEHYEFDVECATAIDELEDTFEVNLYPNPTNGFFKVRTSFDLNYFEVYNVVGRLIERVDGGLNSLDISSYSRGMYIVKAYDKDLKYTAVKLLKR